MLSPRWFPNALLLRCRVYGTAGVDKTMGLAEKSHGAKRVKCPGEEMAKKKSNTGFEYVEPIGDRVLVRKDEPKRETRGGIALPDAAEIPTITGRIVTISAVVENDEELPLRQYDKILFHPKNAIPVDLEHDNQLFVVPVDDIVAVFRREKPEDT